MFVPTKLYSPFITNDLDDFSLMRLNLAFSNHFLSSLPVFLCSTVPFSIASSLLSKRDVGFFSVLKTLSTDSVVFKPSTLLPTRRRVPKKPYFTLKLNQREDLSLLVANFFLFDSSLFKKNSAVWIFPKDTTFPKSLRRRFCFPTVGSSIFFLRKRLHRLLRNRLIGLRGFLSFLKILSIFEFLPVGVGSLLSREVFFYSFLASRFLSKKVRKVFLLPFSKKLFLLRLFSSVYVFSGLYLDFLLAKRFNFSRKRVIFYYCLKLLFCASQRVLVVPIVSPYRKSTQRTLVLDRLPLVSSFSFRPLVKKRKNAAVR